MPQQAEETLPTVTRAKIASKAQALAHRALREKYPGVYRKAYQTAKDELTEQAVQTS